MKDLKKALVILAMLVFLGFGCTSEIDTRQTLHKAGYADVQVGGFAPFACGKGDQFQTKFTATNPRGDRVSGVVCCGLVFKNCTIRF